MALIYLAYNNRNQELVSQYRKLLETRYKHKCITMGINPAQSIKDGMEKADAILVFWTLGAIRSDGEILDKDVSVELEMSVLFANDDRALIVLVDHETAIPEYVLKKTPHTLLATRTPEDNASLINEILLKSKSSYLKGKFTPTLFAKSFHNFLSGLEPKDIFGEWICMGQTDVAYDTPGGSWKEDGFLFRSSTYGFILRSVETSAYLVVESENLQGQLANVDLTNQKKFVNENGHITIYETYDMTAGSGRKARGDVQAAFQKVGMANNIITSFHEDVQRLVWGQILMEILAWAVFREEAKKELLRGKKIETNTSTMEPVVNHWFVRPLTDWEFFSMREGDEITYDITLPVYLGRTIDLIDKTQKVKKGDRGIAYDFEMECAVFLFEVTQPLHKLLVGGHGIRFVVTKVFAQGISLYDFEKYISFATDLLDSFSEQRFFELTFQQYDDIINSAVLQSLLKDSKKHIISHVFSDSPSEEIKDELDFSDDVDALASVMAYRKVQPPLAIGLFGNWGMGKSFFMNKLQKRIDDLQSDPSEVFCERVLQINFNSWHYSDSNLWASLITKIFEDLHNYGKGNPEDLSNLLCGLNSTQELIQETKAKKADIERTISELNKTKKLFDQEVEKQSLNLKSLDFNTIMAAVMKDEGVQAEIKSLKENYSFDEIKEHEEIDRNINKLQSGLDKLIESVKILYTMRHGKAPYILFGTFVFAVMVYILISNLQILKDFYAFYKASAAGILLFLSQFILFLKPTMKRLEYVHGRLKSLKKTVDTLRDKAKATFEEKQMFIQKKIDEAKANADSTQLEIDILEIKIQRFEDDIREIASGKTLMRFIENRVNDTRYINSLGIISWVRKDFERLDSLLGQQRKAQDLDIVDGVVKQFQLDRIILYIDDLDRCSESTVMQVLEAIHLLLAFPLFVVVVGVDPRWIHNALNKQYGKLLNGISDITDSQENKTDTTTNSDFAATSYDYLEKIFQIPFALKPINEKGKSKLLRAQLETYSTISAKVATNSEITSNITSDNVSEKTATPEVSVETLINKIESSIEEFSEDKPIVITNPKALEVGIDEIEFMDDISFLIGDSPRTIKRFGNMYRIIRTHQTFQAKSKEDFFAAILLLAIITGLPKHAHKIFSEIADRHKIDWELELENFLKHHNDINLLTGKLFDRKYDRDDKSYKLSSKLTKMRLSHLHKNMHLISRFSFRNIII